MIWFYLWCGFIGFIVISIPIAAMLDNRAVAQRAAAPVQDTLMADDVADEAQMVEEAEEAEEVVMLDDVAEGGDIIEMAEEL